MPNLQLANGTAIKDVLEWDGAKWISRIVKVHTANGWEECFRPTQFSDTGTVLNGAIRSSTTAEINDGLRFITNIDYDVFAPVGEFTNVELQGNPAVVTAPVKLEPNTTYEYIVHVRKVGNLTNTGYGDYLILDLIGSGGYDLAEQEFGVAPFDVNEATKVFRKVFNSGNPPPDSTFRIFTFQQGGKYIVEKAYLIKR